ncbi:MAG: ABC transporter permease, partial [Sphingobacterium sp.]|nr:ABC transporter permease [Sphingobacterium sp.]
MLKNHLITAWRNITKRKSLTLTNTLGLYAALVFVLLIGAYIWQVFQVNSTLRNKDRQYALQSKYNEPGLGMELTTIGALPKALKEEYPNLIANYYRIDGLTCIVAYDEKIHEESASLGDPTLLDMYGFELYEGDTKTALLSPSSVVITEATALRYFGTRDATGKTLQIKNFNGDIRPFAVTGVLKPTTQNSVMELMPAMRATIFLPLGSQSYFGRDMDNWNNLWIAGFIELQEGVTPSQLQQPIKDLLARHADPKVAANLSPNIKPLDTYYLEDNNGAMRQMILILTLTASFLLLMAIINFINFTVGQSLSRLKEIGVRKIMGSNSRLLMMQLLLEYIIIVTLAGILAIISYPLFKPFFESLLGNSLPEISAFPLSVLIYFIILVLFIGLLSGLYPAYKLANNSVIHAIKNQLKNTTSKKTLRHALLFVQFAVAIFVFICSLVISKQVNTFISEKLGYNKERLLTVQVPRDWSDTGLNRMEGIREQLSRLPQIEAVSLSYGVPGAFGDGVQQVKKLGASSTTDALMITADGHFADTYQIPVIAGQFLDLDKSYENNNIKVVVNRKTATSLGYPNPQEAIGQPIALFNDRLTAEIAAVTEDFYANTMHSQSPAVVWFPTKVNSQYRYLSIRLKDGEMADKIKALEKEWKHLLPDAPFEFEFLDVAIARMY